MGIFKKKTKATVLNPETIQKNERISYLRRSILKISCGVCIAFNGIMMFMLMIRASPISFLFLINLFFLAQTWKKGFAPDV